MSEPRSTGKVAVVAGAGEGTGRSAALAFARDGADVVVGARTASRLDALVEEITALGRRGLAVPFDLADPASCRALVDRAAEELGRVDALVNVATLGGDPSTVEALDADRLRRAFEINVVGVLEVSRAALPHLRAAGGGAIVQVSTQAARVSRAYLSAYTATKAAMVTASKTMAREVGRDGIRVNVLVPGFIEGADLDGVFAGMAERRGGTVEEIRAEAERELLLRRIPTVEDMADAILYLGTVRSRAVTGIELDVNGGGWFP